MDELQHIANSPAGLAALTPRLDRLSERLEFPQHDVTKFRAARLQGMRERTIVMDEAESSGILSQIAETTQSMLFKGASFVLGLGIAYLAVCYGILMPTPEEMREGGRLK